MAFYYPSFKEWGTQRGGTTLMALADIASKVSGLLKQRERQKQLETFKQAVAKIAQEQGWGEEIPFERMGAEDVLTLFKLKQLTTPRTYRPTTADELRTMKFYMQQYRQMINEATEAMQIFRRQMKGKFVDPNKRLDYDTVKHKIGQAESWARKVGAFKTIETLEKWKKELEKWKQSQSKETKASSAEDVLKKYKVGE